MASYSISLWPLLILILFAAVLSSARMTTLPVGTVSSSLGSLLAKQNVVVKAAVNTSLFQARNVSKWATKLVKNKTLSKPELAALRDCVENFGDTFDQINKSLTVLKHLKTETFRMQMSDVQTWMSAALTNENSCLDGFEDVVGTVKELVSNRVQNMCELISNALALVNNLAATRGY